GVLGPGGRLPRPGGGQQALMGKCDRAELVLELGDKALGREIGRASAAAHGSIRLWQMAGAVDAVDYPAVRAEIDLVDAARALLDPPVARQRQFERMQQQHPIDAVMRDE